MPSETDSCFFTEQPPVIFAHPMANCFHRQPADSSDSSGNGTAYSHSLITSSTANNSSSTESCSNGTGIGNSAVGHSDSDMDLLRLMHLAKQTEDSSNSNTNNSSSNGDVLSLVHPVMTTPGRNSNHSGKTVTIASDTQNPATTTVSTKSSGEVDRYVSSFFVGLSFQQGVTYSDVTPAINVSHVFVGIYVWMYVVILFHYGDRLQIKTVYQHINAQQHANSL